MPHWDEHSNHRGTAEMEHRKATPLILGAALVLEHLQQARSAARGAPVFIGSGCDANNAAELAAHADGVIVASALKRDGVLANPVDPLRVRQLRQALDRCQTPP